VQQQRLLDTHSYNILVVEDERLVREALTLILEDQGHQVTAVENGEMALDALSGAEYDIALVDLGLPGMNGYHVAEQVKKRESRIPVLLVTGWGDDVDHDRAKGIGIAGVVSKPYEPQELLRTINEAADTARRRKKR